MDPGARDVYIGWDRAASDAVGVLRSATGRDPSNVTSQTSSASSPPGDGPATPTPTGVGVEVVATDLAESFRARLSPKLDQAIPALLHWFSLVAEDAGYQIDAVD